MTVAPLLAGALLPSILLLAATGLRAAELPAASGPAVAIGVAPFETVAAPGDAPPDLSQLLAERIGARGVARVVGPDQLGAEALAEPDPEIVRAWASGARVGAVVVGRTTRIGTQLSVDLRLRSGESGEVAGTYVAEILRPEQLERVLDRLATQIIEGAVGLSAAAAGSGDASSASIRDSLSDLGAFDSSEPLKIQSGALDAFQEGGARRLVFTKDVRVTQADLTLTADRLEALYPEGGSEPDRLIADGSVVLVRGARRAQCEHARYDRTASRLVCEGRAELWDGEDRMSGDVIEFDIASDRVLVTGAASVLFHPEAEEAEPSSEQAEPSPEAAEPSEGATR